MNARGGLCDACGVLGRLHVDHVHATPWPGNGKRGDVHQRDRLIAYGTGPARGMLCPACNQVAGCLERGAPTSHLNRSAVERYLADRAPRIPPLGPARTTP